MQEGQTWRSLSDLHKPRPMRPVHTQRYLSDVHIQWATGQTRTNCSMVHATCRWLKLLARSIHAFVDDFCHWPTQCCPIDMHIPQLMRAGLCWYFLVLANVGCMKFTNLGWCCLILDDANFSQLIDTCHDLCVQAFVDSAFHCPTFLTECAYSMLMHENVGWCILLLSALTWPIH